MMTAPPPHPDRLCVHTATTKPLSLEDCARLYPLAGVKGITVWRDTLDQRDPAAAGQMLRDAGLSVVSLCRGGFFPALTTKERRDAIDDNLRAIDEAAALGAPMLVLVCGAAPGQALTESRKQIVDGIAACLSHAEQARIKLAIEPLHPMYSDDRSAINTMAQAFDACDQLDHPLVGIACDAYHVWWDPDLKNQVARAGASDRLFAFHICDWLTPTQHLLTDRGLMGEGCINLPEIRSWVEAAGFEGFYEVEIFSESWWSHDQEEYLDRIRAAYLASS
jgi:sugar phosphate isomerase/epimerase